MDDLSNVVKRILLQREIAEWKATRYQLQVRARVARSLGDKDDEFIKQLERIEKALDVLNKELNALPEDEED